MKRRAEDEIMCVTSEASEKPVGSDELPLSDIGLRLQEAFDYDSVVDIALSMRSNTADVASIVEGRVVPTVEFLLAARKLTGVSVDWILTGDGPKFVAGPAFDRFKNKPLPVWAITQIDSIRRAA